MKTVSLAYSTREINRNFRIKVSGVDGEGNKVHKLVGVSGAIALIGVEMFNKLLKRAFSSVEDKCVCKLRMYQIFILYQIIRRTEFMKDNMNSIIEAAFWAGFEPSSDDLTEAALYEEAKAYLEKSIQY